MRITSIISLALYAIVAAIALVYCCLGVAVSPISLLFASITCILLELNTVIRERKKKNDKDI